MTAQNHESWLNSMGPDHDVVVSCRARLARNVEGFPFSNRTDRAQRNQILTLAKRAILDSRLEDTMLWVELDHASNRDRELLVERHLISSQLAQDDQPRAVAVSGNEALSIMVNEEDHLRMQMLQPGFQVGKAYERINEVDDRLAQRLDFSFSERFGYLTACPTNIGTGLRLGVMMHLPALKLTGEIDKVRRAAKDLQLAVRGFFGEGSESTGDFYQISNQLTLGLTEEALLEEFERDIVPRLVQYERAARAALLDRRGAQLDDRVHRAFGILRSARMLGTEEAMKLLSRLRLGVHLERIDTIDGLVIDRLLPQIQAAHLEQLKGVEMDKEQLKVARAELVRGALGGHT